MNKKILAVWFVLLIILFFFLKSGFTSVRVMRFSETQETTVRELTDWKVSSSGQKDENGNYKFEGRFNQGVVSLNLPQIGILAEGDEEKFWSLLEERLALCFEALMCRHHALEGTLSNVSPIHWQYGAIARLKPGETIDNDFIGIYWFI